MPVRLTGKFLSPRLLARSSNERAVTIAVVGGGAAGVAATISVCSHLANRRDTRQRINVILFEKSGRLGDGIAYGVRSCAFTLNMLICEQSIIAGAPSDFASWRVERASWVERETAGAVRPNTEYAPRFINADYHRQRLHETADQVMAEGVYLRVEMQRVDGLRWLGDRWRIATTGSLRFEADYVILALGNFARQPPASISHVAGCIGDPYGCPKELAQIPLADPVIILGSNLSAVDMVRSLDASGHHGPIWVLSRRGSLPLPRPRPTARHVVNGVSFAVDVPFEHAEYVLDQIHHLLYVKRSLDVDEVLTLARALVQETAPELIDWQQLLQPRICTATTLQDEIECAKAGELWYHPLLVAAADLFQPLFDKLDDVGKQRWYREFMPRFQRLAFPMPIVRAHDVLRHMQSGRLIVGRLVGLGVDATGSFEARFELGDESTVRVAQSRHLISAIGQETNIRQLGDPLLRRLRDAGIIEPHPQGGVRVDARHLRVIGANGRPNERLYVLGSLTSGTHCFVYAVYRNLQHAEAIARSIAWSVDRSCVVVANVLNPVGVR